VSARFLQRLLGLQPLIDWGQGLAFGAIENIVHAGLAAVDYRLPDLAIDVQVYETGLSVYRKYFTSRCLYIENTIHSHCCCSLELLGRYVFEVIALGAAQLCDVLHPSTRGAASFIGGHGSNRTARWHCFRGGIPYRSPWRDPLL
jgi:hypothetical protein